jgi:hypothetical protein
LIESVEVDVGVHSDPGTSLERDGTHVLGEIREYSNGEVLPETIQRYP